MEILLYLLLIITGFALGFFSGVRNADSGKVKAAVAAAKIVKDAVKKD